MDQIHHPPSTFCFTRQFDDLVIDPFRAFSGSYEVTADRDREWWISGLWLAGRHEIKLTHALWDPLVEAIGAHDGARIEDMIDREFCQ